MEVASDLRFRDAISEPKARPFCGISGDLTQSTRKLLAIAGFVSLLLLAWSCVFVIFSLELCLCYFLWELCLCYFCAGVVSFLLFAGVVSVLLLF